MSEKERQFHLSKGDHDAEECLHARNLVLYVKSRNRSETNDDDT